MQKKSRKKMLHSDEVAAIKAYMGEDFGVLKHDDKQNPNSEPKGGRNSLADILDKAEGR